MKLKFPREFYVPKGATKVTDKASGAVVYFKMDPKPHAVGFYGAAQKPTFNYTFKTPDRLEAYVKARLGDFRQLAERRAKNAAERKAEAKKPHPLTIGHVLYASWGYDQTNIDFYEVVEVVGPHTVKIRELGQITKDTGFMTGDCLPKMGTYKGEPELRRARADGSIRLESYKFATVWDGQAKRWSSYA